MNDLEFETQPNQKDVRDMSEGAEDIVREIADEDYPQDSNIEEWHCNYCGSYPGDLLVVGYANEEQRSGPFNHPPFCLWRRSIEWVRKNPKPS